MTTELSTTAETIAKLNTAVEASRQARAVDLTKPAPLEPWEIEDALTGHEHDGCPARTVGDGPTVCMVHNVVIPR